MKILINIRSLANKGGAERAIANLAAELVRRGHGVDIAVSRQHGRHCAYPLLDDVQIHCLEGWGSAMPSPWRGYVLQRNLHRLVETHDYDLVLGWLRHGGAMVGNLPPRDGIVRVAAMRNLPYTIAPKTRNPFKLLKFRRRRAALAGADMFLVQMRQFVAMLPASWQPRTLVIPNAVPVSPPPPPYAEREKLIIAVSRIVPQKRLRSLVRGFAKFQAAHPDWKLEIWGQGTAKARAGLQALIDKLELGDKVAIMGTTHDIGAVYRRARILAHASRREGMSNAVTEAMMDGLAVVACADCAGMDELIEDGVTGRLIETGPADRDLVANLAQALGEIADDEAATRQMGLGARHFLIENFAPQIIYDRWERVFLDAIDRQVR